MKKTILGIALLWVLGVNAQLSTGLVAHYTFDDQTFIDQSGNDNHATNDLTTSTVDRFGALEGARNFGNAQQIFLKDSILDFGQALTFSIWFKTTSMGSVNPIVGYQDTEDAELAGAYVPMIFIAADNTIKAKMWDGDNNTIVNSNITVTDGNWHNVVLTADASGQTIVLDKEVIANSTTGYIPLGLVHSQIGRSKSNSWEAGAFTENFIGDLDDVRIYDYKNTNQSFFNELYHEGGFIGASGVDIIYVNQSATGANDGSSWADAYTDARDAFINSTLNDEVWIAQGTYKRDATERNVVFGWLSDSLKVYGGFSGNGTETSIEERDWDLYPTIFSGDLGVEGDNSDNAYTVFTGPLGAVNYTLIDGIKITGGNADENNYPDFDTVGGAMAFDTEVDEFHLRNVEFYGNYAKQGGALSAYGLSGDECKIVLENCIAHDNTGKSSAFAGFRASNQGAIVLEMTNCLIYDNHAIGVSEDHGTVMLLGSNANVANTITATVTNCTFANNTFAENHSSQGMIRLFNQTNAPSELNFTNTICYGNGITEITTQNGSNVVQAFPTINLNHNILENGIDFTATNENASLTGDPLFTDAVNGDFTLSEGSLAIDAGTQLDVMVPLLDLAGNERISGTEIDLGAYEYEADDSVSITEINEKTIAIYPNPSSGLFFIQGIEVDKIVEVSILDMNGKVVLELSNQNQVDVSELSSGFYVVTIQTMNDLINARFIKD